jgi:hypothetical protein
MEWGARAGAGAGFHARLASRRNEPGVACLGRVPDVDPHRRSSASDHGHMLLTRGHLQDLVFRVSCKWLMMRHCEQC